MVFMESQRIRVVVRTSNEKISFRGGKSVQHDYFSFFDQSNHWFVAKSLPSSVSWQARGIEICRLGKWLNYKY